MTWANWVLTAVMTLTGAGGIVGWLQVRAKNKKLLAEAGGTQAVAESTIVNTSNNLVQIVNAHMDRQEQRNRELDARVADLEKQNRAQAAEVALAKGYAHLLYSTLRQQGLEVVTYAEYAAGGGS